MVILEIMHKNGIVHRDFKVEIFIFLQFTFLEPQNLLLNENRHLKAIDFGSVRYFDKNMKAKSRIIFKNLIEK